MTITEVMGRGEQKGIALEYRGGRMMVDLLPKVQVEIIVPYEKVDLLVRTITESCRTGKLGDGMIYIMPVERAIRIRTGDTQEDLSLRADIAAFAVPPHPATRE
jgi:nitrogen regulatory protein P-II 1